MTIISVFALLITSCTGYVPIKTTRLTDQPAKGRAPIVVGDLVNVTMKDRQFMNHVSVTAIDMEKIEVSQTWHSRGLSQHVSKTIMIADLESIKKKKIGAGNTTALVVGLIVGVGIMSTMLTPIGF